ncbi:MAG: hypothetical protein HS113_04620 [Verrucomicrobiales bacterium]|jgi:hypothetical protein|nr:hypothetical protein [Verrucomicrobiales bacterium]
MKDEQHRFLSISGRLPARLTVEQVAWVLNCQPHDIAALVSARLLKPLGNPPVNGIKFFCTEDLLEQIKDRSWLTKVTNATVLHWQRRNGRRKDRSAYGSPNGHSSVLAFSDASDRQ